MLLNSVEPVFGCLTAIILYHREQGWIQALERVGEGACNRVVGIWSMHWSGGCISGLHFDAEWLYAQMSRSAF